MSSYYRYSRCEREKPYTWGPDWEIDPDGGHCHACDHEVHPRDVRRMHAIASEAQRRYAGFLEEGAEK